MKTVKEIRGLKCPNHQYDKYNYNFTYESIAFLPPHSGTRCLICGYTKLLHKPQK